VTDTTVDSAAGLNPVRNTLLGGGGGSSGDGGGGAFGLFTLLALLIAVHKGSNPSRLT
jgi:hypothetical protein